MVSLKNAERLTYSLGGAVLLVAVVLYSVSGDRSVFVTIPLAVMAISLSLVRPLSGSLDRSVRLMQLAMLAIIVPSLLVAAVAYHDGQLLISFFGVVLAVGLGWAIQSETVWRRYRESMEAKRRSIDEQQ